MRIKLLLIIFFLTALPTIYAQNSGKEYLKKVLTKLEKVESATYNITNESWQHGDSTALSILHGFVKEYNNPMDSTIGASYVSLDANDTTKMDFYYDGNIRALTYHDNKKLVIDDFTFRPLPFRPVSPPFFNHTKNIIQYALTTKDHTTLELKDEGNNYYFYTNVGAGQAFKYFYSYELTGQLDDNGMEYISGMNYEELPQIQSLATMGWDGMPLQVDEDGVSHLTLGPEADSILAGIGFSLYYFDEENDIMLLLGTDNDMNADWENGVFSDNFRGVWGGIDGHMVYMELCFEGEDYNLYSVPVLLNGEPYNLQVAYDFTTEEWSILGARQDIGEAGMSDKELRLLQPGDALTTIWYLSSYSGEDGLEAYAVEELTVTTDTAFAEMELPNGRYGMVFEMRDAMDNYAYSDSVFFLCEDGKISTLIYE